MQTKVKNYSKIKVTENMHKTSYFVGKAVLVSNQIQDNKLYVAKTYQLVRNHLKKDISFPSVL